MNIHEMSAAKHAEPPHATVRHTELGRATESDARLQRASSLRVSDMIDVSSRSATAGNLVKRVAEVPDVQQERVELLREVIRSGSYRPSARTIADAILEKEKWELMLRKRKRRFSLDTDKRTDRILPFR